MGKYTHLTCRPMGIKYTNRKPIMEPLSYIMMSADRLVSLIMRDTRIVTPTYMTSLKLTPVGSGHSITPKNLCLEMSRN